MGPGKRLEPTAATLAAFHEAVEVDFLSIGVDLLDHYRGTLSLRRVALLIEHFRNRPGSALFDAIERAVQPATDPDAPSAVDGLEPHKVMQLLRWTEQHELLRQVVIASHHLLSAWTGEPIETMPHPWETTSTSSVARSNRDRLAAYQSEDATAARAVVAPPIIREG